MSDYESEKLTFLESLKDFASSLQYSLMRGNEWTVREALLKLA